MIGLQRAQGGKSDVGNGKERKGGGGRETGELGGGARRGWETGGEEGM